MVILSVSVCNKKGKILIARQYVPMSRLRIEGLLAAFPKLVDSDENASNRQHTFIETNEVRYVYQPLDTLYLLLITNMQSNIIEDLATLRMIAKLIPEYCGGHDEDSVSQRAFELLFALDEVVSPIGYREQVTYSQIDDFIKMESAEEKLVQIIEQSKLESQRQVAKDRAKVFDERRRAENKQSKTGFGIRGLDQLTALSSLASGYGQGSDTRHISSSDMKDNGIAGNVTIISHNNFGGFGNDPSKNEEEVDHGLGDYKPKKLKAKSGQRKVGFKLQSGRGAKAKELFDQVLVEDKKNLKANELNLLDKTARLNRHQNQVEEDDQEDWDMKPVEINIREQMEVIICDDQIQKFAIKGMFEVIVNSPKAAHLAIECRKPARGSIAGFSKRIPWKLHPRMSQKLWDQSATLQLKDAKKSFRIGRGHKTAILKWSLSTKEDIKPIEITFWPEEQGDGSVAVNCNYEVLIEDCELVNVIITFPSRSVPDVASCDHDYTYDRSNKELKWILGTLEAEKEKKGAIEYSVSDIDIAEVYPVSVHFEMRQNYCKIKPVRVYDASEDMQEEPFEFKVNTVCVADKYGIRYAD